MSLQVDAGDGKPVLASDSILIFDEEGSLDLVSKLKSIGYQAKLADRMMSLVTFLEDAEPNLVLFVRRGESNQSYGGSFREVCQAARRLAIPVLLISASKIGKSQIAEVIAEADDWLADDRVEQELETRISGLLARSKRQQAATGPSNAPTADSDFFSLVIHDLRTPLNVIGLSLRMISQAVPKGDPDLDEDLRFVEENFGQIERMLMQLSDYFRLFETNGPLTPIEFSPKRAIEELIATRSNKPAMKFGSINVIIRDSCPEVLGLDPLKARLAFSYVLANASNSAGTSPIQLVLSGNNGHFVAETIIENPPPSSVKSTKLSPTHFMRLCGFTAERRGMDLAIAAKVSEMFGGSARLDVVDETRTSVVLEWPLRLPIITH